MKTFVVVRADELLFDKQRTLPVIQTTHICHYSNNAHVPLFKQCTFAIIQTRLIAHVVQAIECYLGGQDGSTADWVQATSILSECLNLEPNDGPSMAIRAFMGKRARDDGSCPADWRGFRALELK
jgi:hypothetical protein